MSKKIKYERIGIENCPIPVFIEWDIKDYYSNSAISTYELGMYTYLEMKYQPALKNDETA